MHQQTRYDSKMNHKKKSWQNWRKMLVFLTTTIYAILNAWRAVGISQQANFLEPFNPAIGTQVRLYISIGWAVVFTILAVNLWRNHKTSKIAIPATILIYALYRFRLITQFAQSSYMQQSVTFFTFLHILIALMVFITNRHYNKSYV